MSAIYGKLNFNKKPIDPHELGRIEKTLNHWEADDKGMWHSGSTGMGHLMLYNTPESLHEKLPFYHNDSRLTITADARIDNRDELFNKLGLPKTNMHLIADSLLILQAYQRYGEDCVKHLVGDFAFAIWDEKEQKLFCGRDHTGVKPFFYYSDAHFFAFATEAKALLIIDGLNAAISENYFLKLAVHLRPEKAETAYQHIYRLNCASVLVVKNAAVSVRKYWELDTSKEIIYKDKTQYVENFRVIFKEAVRCRIRSNYLIGTELSGGLDSPGIAAMAADLLHTSKKKIASFTILEAPKEDYDNPLNREELYVDEMISSTNIDFVYKFIDNKIKGDVFQEIDDWLAVYGYPCFGPSGWNNYIYETASSMNIRTMLSGLGGDQLVTGYNKNYVMQYINNQQYKTYFKIAIKELGIKHALTKFISTKVNQPLPDFINKIMNSRAYHKLIKDDCNFLSPTYFHQISPYIQFEGFPVNFKEVQKRYVNNNYISDRMEFETLNGLKKKISPVFPMQDTRLMEYVLALPTDEKMQFGKDRYIYRRAMQGLMPERVITGPKYHIASRISPNQTKWLCRQSQIKNWILELENNKRLPPFINYNKLMQGYTYQPGGKIDFNKLLTPKRKKIELIIRWFENYKADIRKISA